MSDHFFSQLFNASNDITPYLSGEFGEIGRDTIHVDNDINPIIRALFIQLSEEYPEAGNAYWLTRTWDLLCWQPVYIAILSIYRFQSLPDISGMAQHVQPCFVTGYRFNDDSVIRGEQRALIEVAGQQIRTLFNFYQSQMSEWIRIRPGFTHQLMSDGILSCLLKLQQCSPQLSNSTIKEHAVLWLQALDLDVNNANSLYALSTKQPIQLVRKSCCQVHKCDGRKFCDDCPKLAKNRQIIAKMRDIRK
ncbi:siderophore ferric iron reductase [Vibrio sp. B1FLJ16]|uniref:siderophore ferric iron reductase n=1 Tax=Vibrio sp. B1FLJ16 TaxID=2751178 RepID=UPI0015F3C239|nr:siderophore ferric iron reductase [Vibrio sp. B1FLJ16]CAD7819711.1 hypothetical protein ACOMICROBIO_EPCKBFOG_03702 [Vibrio sp. B1FLJ16]CAE6940235.1 hypothetical protein ACOMICROBIO_EPCKBFOG_03702 [Vibrio sp. B1FLJ16]